MLSVTLLAYAMIVVFMVLVMSGRVSALIALILVPLAFGALAGFGGDLGKMSLDGIRTLAPTGVLLLFAILYFGVMIDAGLFDPVVRLVLRAVKGDPVRIVVGTAILALVVSLDGDGSTTYIITCSAMLPLHRRLKLDPLIAPCVIIMAAGVTNVAPWGGPTARAASALHVDPNALFVPLLPSLLACALWVVFTAWFLGRRERARVGVLSLRELDHVESPLGGFVDTDGGEDHRRPKLLPFNAALTAVLMACLIAGLAPAPLLFMVAFAIAMLVNYPTLEQQKARIASHAPNVLAVVSLIFAAGVFTGVLSGTGMVEAMAKNVVALIPEGAGQFLPLVTAVASLPFTFFISNDAFYFGVVPILAEAGRIYGHTAEAIGRASLVGQQVHLLSPLVPSTYLLVSLAGVEFGRHQRFTLGWASASALVMLLIGALTGAIPLL
ncbi:Ca2+/citrate complex secondary transporter [Roseomonas mucosa]|uniref:Citrate transporter n=1 Tax=Roseomonas mucosa TaxID=207340 RepID=A0A379N137_9PROT|nr:MULTISPECIES: CitMHS family transporter [Roseomonas]MBS5901861.1 CitMHS family transporter [Acetobacteraceae bacterium]MCG7352194.1 CitMHS family transporter [Roseomonas mucosa]MCG7356659.1 CitMHS family transporter [Roseomonas mucosa]MDT8289691.1 CitMHS family transporter [Roseomonas mucosa]MDT8294624.1 CitMHS family transporter [Roseomonas mucosa]